MTKPRLVHPTHILIAVVLAMFVSGGSAYSLYYADLMEGGLVAFFACALSALIVCLFFTHMRVALSLVLILASGPIGLYLYQRTGVALTKLLDEVVFVMFGGSVLVSAILTRRRLYLDHGAALVILALWGAISSVINAVPTDIAFVGGVLVLKPIMVFLVYQNALVGLGRYREFIFAQIRTLLEATPVLSLLYVILFELVGGHNWLPGFSLPERLGLTPSRSFFTHPGVLGSVMAVMSVYHFATFLTTARKRSCVLFGCALLGVALSLRVKSLLLLPLVLCLVLFVFYTIRKPRRYDQILLFLLFLCLICSIIVILAFIFQNELDFYFAPDSSAVRTILLKTALLINQETLGLGKGFGTYGSSVSVSYHYSDLYYKYGIAYLHGATPYNYAYITDQWWAWFLGEIGIVGTLIFLTWMSSLALDLYRVAKHSYTCNKELSGLALSSLGILTYGIASGYADANLTTPPTGYLIMGIAGIVMAFSKRIYGMVQFSREIC